MKVKFEEVRRGVTAAKGFAAGGVFAGLKRPGKEKRDLGMILSSTPCVAAGVFSQNSVLSPSTSLSSRIIKSGKPVRGIVVNSGCANCAVGTQGHKDAKEMGLLAAQITDADAEEILVASTGVIGVELPMALIRKSIAEIEISPEGNEDFAKSILTTDTCIKEKAVRLNTNGGTFTIGGVAKGSGMIHPNMATMLAFITTDASVDRDFLQRTLTKAVSLTFNQIDVDGDQSTNDMVVILANGASGADILSGGDDPSDAFAEGLRQVCEHLAKEVARDGEGAKHLMEAVVSGASSEADARKAALSIVSSTLVKTAIYGNDPNWGRIMMALGKTEIPLEEARIEIFLNGIQIVDGGKAIAYNVESVVHSLAKPEITIQVDLNSGTAEGRAWGCDLTEEYVVFNSAYTT